MHPRSAPIAVRRRPAGSHLGEHGVEAGARTPQQKQVGAILRTADAAPQLVRHDGLDWHLYAVDAERPFAERIAVETAIAFVDLIRLEETERCKRCAAPHCGLPMLDLSRNRSRRFCSTACQSRVNVAAYRARAR